MRFLVVLFALVAAAVAAPSVEKRSIGHVVAYSVPSAVSHQSRVDVHSSPAVVAAPVEYASVVGPTVYTGASAVSHQSRVDVHSSPAVVSEHVVGPALYETRSVYAPSAYASHVYAPSVYAPSAYASQVYAPSVYASYW